MEPFTIGLIISAIVSATTSVIQAQIEAQIAVQEQAVKQYNANLERQQAVEEKRARAQESLAERQQTDKESARMEGIYAKSGLLPTGTVMHMLTEKAEDDAFNTLTKDRVSAFRVNSLMAHAEILEMEGDQAVEAGEHNAKVAILGGIGKVATATSSYGLNIGAINDGTPAPERDGVGDQLLGKAKPRSKRQGMFDS